MTHGGPRGAAATLYEKIWRSHLVSQRDGHPALLYIDLHLIHEVSSAQAFAGLRERGIPVRRPDRSLAVVDHSVPTTPPGEPIRDGMAAAQIRQIEINCAEAGIPLFARGHPRQGIVHVTGPELGLTQPGMTIVCGDSHTSTHGAFGALAFGIGSSEVEHVLAAQCLLQRKSRTMEVRVDGALGRCVTAKDLILALIAKIGTGGATGHVLEYRGSAIRALTMEQRMTVCNMSIEAGARAGQVAPDETTFEYLSSLPMTPAGKAWERALQEWSSLVSDEQADFDSRVRLDAGELEPMITYGTNPGMAIPVRGAIPDPAGIPDPQERATLEKALSYMDLRPGSTILGQAVQVVFIGSCTNGRLSDLRLAASALQGRKLAEGVRALVVPGSQRVKRLAEAEGLDEVFRDAGAEWREPGCSMCVAINDDRLSPGQYAVSTSNRNFENRQGQGGRTFLASPLTAAASAVAGRVADPRGLK